MYYKEIQEYGQLFRIRKYPDNKHKKNIMYMVPVNKSGWYIPHGNYFWANRCCYIIKQMSDNYCCNISGHEGMWRGRGKNDVVVEVIICHEMFVFKKDYLIFQMLKSDLEECNLSYLLQMQLIKEEGRCQFLNSEGYKFIKSLLNKL